jgi:hypothetical membrane protein
MAEVVVVRKNLPLLDRPATPRILALAGVIAPIMFWIILILAGLLRHGYNPITQYASELGIGPNAWLMNANFILYGLLEIAFAYGLHRGITDGDGAKLGPVLVGIAGFAMILVGLFNAPMTGRHTLPGSIHARAAELLFCSMIAAFFVLPRRLRQDRRWQGYARYSVPVGALALLLFVVYMWGGQTVRPWIGLEQRLLLAVTLGWLAVLAARLRVGDRR